MSKKKLIITITSLCLVIVAAVAAVVGVVAASTQTVTSTITVNYKATNVKAEVSYAKRLASTTYSSNAGTVTFDATEATRTTSNSIAVPAITLGNSGANQGDAWSFERYAIVRFAFHNLYASGQGRTLNVATSATVTAYNTASGKNYAIAFAKGTTEPTVPTTLTGLSGDAALAESWLTGNENWSATPSSASLSVAQGATSYIYVLVAMINPLLDASLSSQSLTFTLTSPTT